MKGALVLLCLMGVALVAVNAFECADVARSLGKCAQYLTGGSNDPTPDCCVGVQDIKKFASTDVASKQKACGCIKALAQQMTNLKDAAAIGLPAKCGTTVDVPISRDVDCSKIHYKYHKSKV